MKRGRISIKRLFMVTALLVCSAPAEAGFLEDLFGGSDYDTPSAPLRKSRLRAAARHSPVKDARSRPNYGRSEIRFMPFHAERIEERRSIVHRGLVYRQSLLRSSSANEDRRGPPKIASNASGGASAGGKPDEPSLCKREDSSPASTNAFLYDRTLRSGDAVVTEKGVQIFHGQKTCPHGADNFVALSSAFVPKSHRNVLLAIESAIHRPNGYLITAKNGR